MTIKHTCRLSLSLAHSLAPSSSRSRYVCVCVSVSVYLPLALYMWLNLNMNIRRCRLPIYDSIFIYGSFWCASPSRYTHSAIDSENCKENVWRHLIAEANSQIFVHLIYPHIHIFHSSIRSFTHIQRYICCLICCRTQLHLFSSFLLLLLFRFLLLSTEILLQACEPSECRIE